MIIIVILTFIQKLYDYVLPFAPGCCGIDAELRTATQPIGIHVENIYIREIFVNIRQTAYYSFFPVHC